MSGINNITRYFALVVGIAFVLAGIAGFIPFFTPPPHADAPHLILNSNYGLLLGLFPVNTLHSIFHFSTGVFGMYAFRNYRLSRIFSRFLGVTLGIFTVMGLIPRLHTTFGYLPLYGHDVWLHGLEAVIGLYLGFFARQTERESVHVRQVA
ncbi:MAG: DUF4383 domain-containing protein [Chloroflexi bacterium]|nr:DUF4383 domain-containing protein [Chloroflexota bacterium]MDL1944629.1 DUF4383 domain-containing protein [Chloroflexi bacterium CFX2]